MSYGYGKRRLPHYTCEMCGEELPHGCDCYEAEDGGYICEDCIDDYLDEWKREHKMWLQDATDYSDEEDRYE